MTIPTLMQSYQENVYITQFKDTYSMIQQAYLLAAQENGTADTWDTTEDGNGTVIAVYNNMKPYFKVTKDCLPYCSFNGHAPVTLAGDENGFDGYNLYLANGATLFFAAYDSGVNQVAFDINGPKPPNKWGVDYFVLKLTSKKGAPFVDAYSELELCTKGTNGGWYGGISCPYWILRHWNMDYLHRDISAAEWN